ncbi:hypothetical protein Ndes2437B_g06963 [Nannochloris sp. 'desiccata']
MSSTQKKQSKAVADVTKQVSVADTAPPATPPSTAAAPHGQAAEIHASEAKNKAVEAGSAAGESASEATLAAKEKLSQATAQATEATKESTKATAQTVADKTHYAGEKVADATAVAKEKLTEAGETVQTGVHNALEFIKEHLPRVEHEDLTPEERQSKALLDEAMGRPGETTGLPSEVEVIEKNRPLAESLVAEGAILDEGGAPEPGPESVPLPSELLGGETEDRSAKGLAEVMGEKAGEAKEYVRRPGRATTTARPGSPRPPVIHEYSALPGDIHIPLVKKALREHVLHRPGHQTTAADTTPGTTTTTARDIPFSPSSSAEEIIADSKRKAAEATKTAEEKAAHAAHSVGDTLSEYYHKVADPLTGVLHSAEDKASGVLHSIEDKAKWTYDHTKDELIGKSATETHQEMLPKNAYEAELAHGAIPSSTEEVLAKQVGGASLEEKYQGPQTPSGGTGGMRDAEAEDALTKVQRD